MLYAAGIEVAQQILHEMAAVGRMKKSWNPDDGPEPVKNEETS